MGLRLGEGGEEKELTVGISPVERLSFFFSFPDLEPVDINKASEGERFPEKVRVNKSSRDVELPSDEKVDFAAVGSNEFLRRNDGEGESRAG